MTGFRKELTLLVLDKVVFGLLIVVAAFLFNRILDQHRAQTTFEAEFAKERADRVATILSVETRRDAAVLKLTSAELRAVRALKAQDAAINAGRVHHTKFVATQRALDRSVGEIEVARSNLDALPHVEPLLQANRFWLGKELYAVLSARVALEARVESRAPVLVVVHDPEQLAADIAAIRQLQTQASHPLDVDQVTKILSSGG
jgi:hypothetical protein